MNKILLSGFADEIDMDLSVQIDEMKKLGIKYIEMRGVNGKNIGEITLEEAKNIKKELDTKGIKISSLGSPTGKIYMKEDFEVHKKMFKNLLEISKILDTRYIRVFSFFMETEEEYSSSREEIIKRLIELTKLASEYDVILLHENEKDIYGDTMDRCLDLVENIPYKNFKLLLDPANYVQCGEDPLKAFNLLKDHIEYLHIKDAKSEDSSVVPAGKGDGKINEIIELLKENNYNGFLSLEPHLGEFEGFLSLENIEALEDSEKSDSSKFALAYNSLTEILDSRNISY